MRFVHLVSRGKVSMVGAIIVSILLPVLIVSAIFDILGLIDNPYFGFLLYVVMAPLLLLGVLLIIVGAIFFQSKEEIGIFTVEYLKEQLTRPGRYTRIRRLIYFTVALTLLLVFIVGLVSYSSFTYTTSSRFCGQFCHTVMEPQYTAYKNSPHSRVACVQCHLGKDASLSERSRFTGLKQLFSVATNSYPRPILPPIKALRPGRATCEQCHLPDKFHGSRLYSKEHFLPDEQNTRVTTMILMKVGSGDMQGRKANGVHWHVSGARQLQYRTMDKEQTDIVEVRQIEKGKKDIVYTRTADPVELSSGSPRTGTGELRTMDCIDCHNRPTHIFLSANEALDQKIKQQVIPAYLPFIKRQALAVITKTYDSREKARLEISRTLQDWYQEHYPELIQENPDILTRAVQGTIAAYEENVFSDMNVTWGIYSNNLGHKDDSGCFRCHGRLQEEKSGRVISNDCTLCHILWTGDQIPTQSLILQQHLQQAQGERNDN